MVVLFFVKILIFFLLVYIAYLWYYLDSMNDRSVGMKIAVSVLDCLSRVDSTKQLNNVDVDYIHVDVMDGNFVPKVSFDNIEEFVDIDNVSKYPLDVHLMVDNPSEYIFKLRDLNNIEYITFHLEIDRDIDNVITLIKESGCKVGISIKPGTDIEKLEPYLDDIDLVLVMSVEPGMGGQKFMDETVERLSELRTLISKIDRDIMIEVDGGVNDETIKNLIGVDIAVVGSYITKSGDYKERIDNLKISIDDMEV